MRNIICGLILAAIVAAVQWGLRQLTDSVDVLSFLAICGGLTALMIAAAFAWDWHEARSRRYTSGQRNSFASGHVQKRFRLSRHGVPPFPFEQTYPMHPARAGTVGARASAVQAPWPAAFARSVSKSARLIAMRLEEMRKIGMPWRSSAA
jgi:hypothetical protein